MSRWRVEYADEVHGTRSTWYDGPTADEARRQARRDGLHSLLAVTLDEPTPPTAAAADRIQVIGLLHNLAVQAVTHANGLQRHDGRVGDLHETLRTVRANLDKIETLACMAHADTVFRKD